MKSCLKKHRLEFPKWEMGVIDLTNLVYVIFDIGYCMAFWHPLGDYSLMIKFLEIHLTPSLTSSFSGPFHSFIIYLKHQLWNSYFIFPYLLKQS